MASLRRWSRLRNSELWNEPQGLSLRQSERTEVTPVQREHGRDTFSIGQIQERCIGKLDIQVFVFYENGRYVSEFGLVQLKDLEWPAAECGKQSPDRLEVGTQKPCNLRQHRPACQERPVNLLELFDANAMVRVRF